MLAIRLARTGRNKYPTYRIVAAESSRPTTGKFVAILGHYNPHTKELVIKKEETVKYLTNGAQPSNTVIKLLQREKVELPKWAKLVTKDKKSKHAPAEPAEKPAETAKTGEVTAEPEEATVGQAAEANAEAVTDNVSESAPEDTAEGEQAQAEVITKAETAGDAAVEAAQAEKAE